MRGEELDRFVDAHREHVADRLAAPAHRERLGVEARAVADFARRPCTSGRKLISIVFTPWPSHAVAAPAGGVEREAARGVAAHARFAACRRRAGGSRPRSRRRSPGTSAASCRSASGRPRARARRSPSRRDRAAAGERARLAPPRLADELAQVRVQHVARERRSCREPDTPVTTTSRPSGMRASTFLQVVQASRRRPRSPGCRSSTARRGCSGCASGCARKRPVSDCGDAHRAPSAVPCATTSPPQLPAPGPRSITCVGAADRVLVVLDDDQRVALRLELRQRVEQHAVVARMQADRRLVEDVADAAQVGAELRREPDALRLAAGERRRGAVEREIAEPDLARGTRAATASSATMSRAISASRPAQLELREEALRARSTGRARQVGDRAARDSARRALRG